MLIAIAKNNIDKENNKLIQNNANLINLVQNTNELYKNTSHNMRSKTLKIISHNHIKIKVIKIIGSKNRKPQKFFFKKKNKEAVL